jgi:cytochrome c
MQRVWAVTLVLLCATPALAQTAGDPAAGEDTFKKCKTCHLADSDQNRIGPSLKGVVGRKAASVAGFNYSPAMKAKGEEGMVWDAANLDKYMVDPKGFIPGNKMVFVGIKDEAERANVIAYLKKASGQ